MKYEVKIYKEDGEKDFVVLNKKQYKKLQDDVDKVVTLFPLTYKMGNGDLVVINPIK